MSALDREQPWLEVREETSSSSESGLDCGPIEKKEDLCAKEEELPLPGAARRESGNSRQFDLGRTHTHTLPRSLSLSLLLFFSTRESTPTAFACTPSLLACLLWPRRFFPLLARAAALETILSRSADVLYTEVPL